MYSLILFCSLLANFSLFDLLISHSDKSTAFIYFFGSLVFCFVFSFSLNYLILKIKVKFVD